ncbi:MAG: hypothetical protein BZY88_07310 [SAR202 cluster bacterium Io17-Chloro-G9]|nr:MAG: hypothetical protein BZY88_07310 [SAR202 cluster bacterium Io17-Chloro-G9]
MVSPALGDACDWIPIKIEFVSLAAKDCMMFDVCGKIICSLNKRLLGLFFFALDQSVKTPGFLAGGFYFRRGSSSPRDFGPLSALGVTHWEGLIIHKPPIGQN